MCARWEEEKTEYRPAFNIILRGFIVIQSVSISGMRMFQKCSLLSFDLATHRSQSVASSTSSRNHLFRKLRIYARKLSYFDKSAIDNSVIFSSVTISFIAKKLTHLLQEFYSKNIQNYSIKVLRTTESKVGHN